MRKGFGISEAFFSFTAPVILALSCWCKVNLSRLI